MILKNHNLNPRPKDDTKDDQALPTYLFQLRWGLLSLHICKYKGSLPWLIPQGSMWLLILQLQNFSLLQPVSNTDTMCGKSKPTNAFPCRQAIQEVTLHSNKLEFAILQYPSSHYLVLLICNFSLAGNTEEILKILENKLNLVSWVINWATEPYI